MLYIFAFNPSICLQFCVLHPICGELPFMHCWALTSWPDAFPVRLVMLNDGASAKWPTTIVCSLTHMFTSHNHLKMRFALICPIAAVHDGSLCCAFDLIFLIDAAFYIIGHIGGFYMTMLWEVYNESHIFDNVYCEQFWQFSDRIWSSVYQTSYLDKLRAVIACENHS